MISSAILGRYARSLAEVVFEQNIEAEVTEDLKTYSEIFKAVPDLLEAFDSPGVPRQVKERLLDSVIEVHPAKSITHNFLKVLLQHNRITCFQQIYESYLDAVNEHNGYVSAKVSTALPLDSPELQALGERLSGATGKQVNMEPQTDAGLLGGIVVQIGDTIFDGSIKTKLAEMKRRLAEA
ncbi:MAG: ATP synthase F1 subunit delta [Acidobacteria bacterium]|nr:ATP synthase F1 subunit delta [Acidobacteriota bacterium]